ncbi:MAG: demethoxyubiquinone hydroxylase family protein [Alphaproteobacteria bacterium]|nr:demethoxyubiquinone hydroxylase family protein [Alphaproteobacteria bacterium]
MPHAKKISEIIRVNHAGEMGAKVIYDGQILALRLKGDKDTLKVVEDMKKQEIEHFNYFNDEIKKQKIRPTLMQPIWGVGGFALGFLTALVDKKSAMTCTTSVEEVIDEHYQQQINDIERIIESNYNEKSQNDLKNLQNNLKKFRAEEIEHRDTAYDHNARDFVAYKPLSRFIKFTTKMAISISKKF